MRFLEYETWRLKKNIDPAAYDKIISDWFKFLKDNYDELFPEWVSAKYYRQTDREGNPTGVFIMVFEYDSLERTGTVPMRPIRRSIRIRSSLILKRLRPITGSH